MFNIRKTDSLIKEFVEEDYLKSLRRKNIDPSSETSRS